MFVGDLLFDSDGHPINGWSFQDVQQLKCHTPSNDIYDNFLFYVRNVVIKFMFGLHVGRVKQIKLFQLDFDRQSLQALSKEFDLTDISNMDNTMATDGGFVETVESVDRLLVDGPNSTTLYRCHATNPSNTLLLHLAAARANLKNRTIRHLANWLTCDSAPDLYIIEWKRCDCNSSNEEVVNTP
jgi:hypothetical protein